MNDTTGLIVEPWDSPRSNIHPMQVLGAEHHFYHRCLADPDIVDFMFLSPYGFEGDVSCTHVALDLESVYYCGFPVVHYWIHDQQGRRSVRGWVRRSQYCPATQFWAELLEIVGQANDCLGCQCGQNDRNRQAVALLVDDRRQIQEADEIYQSQDVELLAEPVEAAAHDDEAFDQLVTALQRSPLLRTIAILSSGQKLDDPPGLYWCELLSSSHRLIYGRFLGNGVVRRLLFQPRSDVDTGNLRSLIAPALGLPLIPFGLRANYCSNLEESPTARELLKAIGEEVVPARVALPPPTNNAPLPRPVDPDPPLAPVESEEELTQPPSMIEELPRSPPPPETAPEVIVEPPPVDQRLVEAQLAVTTAQQAQAKAEKKTTEVRREVERFVRRRLGLSDINPLPSTIFAQLALVSDAHDALAQQLQQMQTTVSEMISPNDHTMLRDELTTLQAAHAGCEDRIRTLEAGVAQAPPAKKPDLPINRPFKELVAELDDVPLLVLVGDYPDQLAKSKRGGRGLGAVRQLVRGLSEVDPPRTLGWLLRRLANLKKKEQAKMDDIVHAELAPYLAMTEGKQRAWTDDLLDQLYELGAISQDGAFDPSGVTELLVARWRQRTTDLLKARVL